MFLRIAVVVGILVGAGLPQCVAQTAPAKAASKASDTKVSKPFRVVLANDPRLPAVTKETVKEALKIASNWIEVWYRKRIRFEIVQNVDVDSYMAAYFKRLPIPRDWMRYPYGLDGSDSFMRFFRSQADILRKQSLPVLQSYVPESVRPLITTPEDAAYNILALYDAKLRVWKSLRTPAGVPFFDTSFPIRHSYWYWQEAFESVWPDSVTDHLIVTNVMLLDDALGDAPPHSLLRGGVLNGMAEEECPQAVVTTFPILTDIPAVSDLRDTSEFTPKDRVLALAHIIGHEFGAHVIQGYSDVYDHRACLAVPTSGLSYTKTIRNLFDGEPCKLDHPMLDRRARLADRYDAIGRRYLEVKDYASARRAYRRALELDPNRPLIKRILNQLEQKK